MKIQLTITGTNYSVDLDLGESIAITLFPNGEQPNHFDAPVCSSKALESGDFIGDTRKGGSCNVAQLTIVPHCNGTHTESISHIVNQKIPVYQAMKHSFFPTVVVSVTPELASTVSDSYQPNFDNDNWVITRGQLEQLLCDYDDEYIKGLAIRTLPNLRSKKSRTYDTKNYPVYLTSEAMHYIVHRNIEHLMVDFPSVDKMYDEGQLNNHRYFWKVETGEKDLNTKSDKHKTITEMIYIRSSIADGLYLCNLQIPEIETDAIPSRPILYRLEVL